MKKYFLLIVFLFSLLPSFAQEPVDFEKYKPTPFISELEIFGGPSISFLRGNIGVEDSYNRTRKAKVGYAFGLGLNHVINNMFAINSKFLFERKGGVVEGVTNYYDIPSQTFMEGEYREDYDYNYYTFPISVVYTLPKPKNFEVGLGVFISYLDKQTQKITHYFNNSININDHTNYNTNFDFGLSASIGYEIILTSKYSLNFQLLNTLGLLNTRLNLNEGVMKSNNTSLLLGFNFKR